MPPLFRRLHIAVNINVIDVAIAYIRTCRRQLIEMITLPRCFFDYAAFYAPCHTTLFFAIFMPLRYISHGLLVRYAAGRCYASFDAFVSLRVTLRFVAVIFFHFFHAFFSSVDRHWEIGIFNIFESLRQRVYHLAFAYRR